MRLKIPPEHIKLYCGVRHPFYYPKEYGPGSVSGKDMEKYVGLPEWEVWDGDDRTSLEPRGGRQWPDKWIEAGRPYSRMYMGQYVTIWPDAGEYQIAGE